MNPAALTPTDWTAIEKDVADLSPVPNLIDYDHERARFDWASVVGRLSGSEGFLNIGFEALDRHVADGNGDRTAIHWLSKARDHDETISYAQLLERTRRFHTVLSQLGVQPGDRLFALCGRVPLLYVAALGALRYGAVFCPLFSAFGPEPIRQRMESGACRVLVTTRRLYQRKVKQLRDELPDLEHVLLVDVDSQDEAPEGTRSLPALLAAAPASDDLPSTAPEDHALLHFTSGTTGKPKGAVHVHQAVLMHYASARYALDLQPTDVYWCTADPGWVTGTSYGIIAPLLHGTTMLVDEAEFDAEHWYQVLEEFKVSVWYTAPTAVRMLMKAGTAPASSRSFENLRFIASVGEPLNPEAVVWGVEAFGMPIHDNWWQTETGGIMIANYPAMAVRPGSMGKPLPGIEAGIVRRLGEDQVEEITEPDVEGELALRVGWPSMFRDYLDQPERYAQSFCDGWYLSGDLARRDADGYFWFVGRADDVIKTAGHLIGPFEVESVLMEHPAVAEAGVIGIPDEVAGAVVKAFVVLHRGFEGSDELMLELLGFCRKRLGAAVAPRQIAFAKGLPKTRSGKILRRLIKARELGLDEGDTSTLEEDNR